MRVGLLSCLLLVASATRPAAAGLEWATRSIELKPAPHETRAIAEYAFINTGRQPITILSAEAGCDDCTAAKPEPATIPPGGKGRIAVTFEFAQRVGFQEKLITVTTTDRAEPKTELRLRVHIPELLAIAPKLVYWRKGESAAAKTIRLSIADGLTMKLTAVRASNDRVTAELKTVEEGRTYELIVTPSPQAAPGTVVLTVQSDFPAAGPRTFQAFAKVLP